VYYTLKNDYPHCETDCVKAIITAGADVNAVGHEKITPLYLAAYFSSLNPTEGRGREKWYEYESCVDLLCERKADVNGISMIKKQSRVPLQATDNIDTALTLQEEWIKIEKYATPLTSAIFDMLPTHIFLPENTFSHSHPPAHITRPSRQTERAAAVEPGCCGGLRCNIL
jgi:hypothetical protein